MRQSAAIVLAALALAGCGKDEDRDKTGTAKSGTSANAPSPGSTTASGGSTTQGGQTSSNATTPSTGATGESSSPTAPAERPGKAVGFVRPSAGSATDRRAIVRTVKAYVVALGHGDGSQACAQLTFEGRIALQRKLARIAPETAGSPCEASITLYRSTFARSARHPRVTRVRIKGDRATAVGPPRRVVVLLKRGDFWKIVSYAD